MSSVDRQVLQAMQRTNGPLLTKKERQQVSLARVVAALVAGSPSAAGLEYEVSQELARRQRREPSLENGIFVSPEMFGLQRDLNAASAGAGGYLSDDRIVGFLELARPRSVLLSLGATFIEGLTSNATIPRVSGAISTSWLGSETTAATEGTPSFGQITLTPKTVSAYTEMSRQLSLQASESAKRFVEGEAIAAVGQAIDNAGINGAGGSGEPEGIMSVSGIGAVDGSSIAHADIVNMQADAGDTLSEFGGYVAPVATAEVLATRETVANTGRYLWAGNLYKGKMAGYSAMASNNVPTGRLLFGGDWSTVLVAQWGEAIELAVNPYQNFPAGIIGLTVVAQLDIAVRRPTTFSLSTTVT